MLSINDIVFSAELVYRRFCYILGSKVTIMWNKLICNTCTSASMLSKKKTVANKTTLKNELGVEMVWHTCCTVVHIFGSDSQLSCLILISLSTFWDCFSINTISNSVLSPVPFTIHVSFAGWLSDGNFYHCFSCFSDCYNSHVLVSWQPHIYYRSQHKMFYVISTLLD